MFLFLFFFKEKSYGYKFWVLRDDFPEEISPSLITVNVATVLNFAGAGPGDKAAGPSALDPPTWRRGAGWGPENPAWWGLDNWSRNWWTSHPFFFLGEIRFP